MSLVAPERAGMASGISGTLRQVGVALGFAGLGSILVTRLASSFDGWAATVGTHFDTHLAIANIERGDIAGSAALVPASLHARALEAAATAYFAGFHAILIAATIVAAVAAIVSWALMRTATRPASQLSPPVR